MATPDPADGRPATGGRAALIWSGVATAGLGAAAAVTWAVVTVVRMAAEFYESHHQQVVAGAVLVLTLAVTAAIGVLSAKRRDRAVRTRIRRVGHLRQVDLMSGPMFEEFVADLLRRDGYRTVRTVGRSGDRGADVVARTRDGRWIAVQCKRQVRNVGSDRVRNLIGAVHGGYSGHVGVLVTSSAFTRPALAEAADRLVLIDRDRLAAWMDGDRLVL